MKHNKIKHFFALILISVSTQLYAQMGMGKIEEIEEVKSRKLIVMIEEPREKMLKKIAKKSKRGSVEDYKNDLKRYNESMKLVVEKFWPYNKEGIQYMTFKEIETLKKTKSKDFAVMACISAEARSTMAGFNYAEGLYWTKDIKEDFEDRKDDMFSVILINRIEDWGKLPVYYTPLFDVFPTKASIAYGIMNIENYFASRINSKKNGVKLKDQQAKAEVEMKERAPKLAEKTLLIREEWLDKELTASNFRNFYPYKYEICTREKMDQVVMEQNKNYAYGVELPYVVSSSRSTYVVHFQFVMDAFDNQPTCVVKPSTGSMMMASSLTGKAGTRNFTIKTMQKIVGQIKGKPLE